jgi:hypothetical protein
VTRKEIKDALWPDESHGDFDSRLNFAVKKLRDALGDDAERPRYIHTERKAGYRFIAAVCADQRIRPATPPDPLGPVAVASLAEQPATRSGGAASTGSQFDRSVILLALIALVSIAALGSYVFWRPAGIAAQSSPTRGATVDDSKPEIFSVTPILPQARQRIVIKGRGFGIHVPYARTDTPYLAIRDDSAHWAAGRVVPHNWDEVMVDVESWTDDQIVIGGFSGDYGKNGWKLSEGDDVQIVVWNPENGVGPASYHVRVIPPRSGG